MINKYCFLIICMACSYVAVGQAPLSPEQQRLSIIQGRWTVPGSEETYLEVCDWIEGNHLQCISTSTEEDGIHKSMSYFTYNKMEKQYVYFGLYNRGGSRMLKGNWETDRFVFIGERVGEGKRIQWRVTLKAVDKDLHFIEEHSENGGTWKETANFLYKRLP